MKDMETDYGSGKVVTYKHNNRNNVFDSMKKTSVENWPN